MELNVARWDRRRVRNVNGALTRCAVCPRPGPGYPVTATRPRRPTATRIRALRPLWRDSCNSTRRRVTWRARARAHTRFMRPRRRRRRRHKRRRKRRTCNTRDDTDGGLRVCRHNSDVCETNIARNSGERTVNHPFVLSVTTRLSKRRRRRQRSRVHSRQSSASDPAVAVVAAVAAAAT